jgi:hypothetical protein
MRFFGVHLCSAQGHEIQGFGSKFSSRTAGWVLVTSAKHLCHTNDRREESRHGTNTKVTDAVSYAVDYDVSSILVDNTIGSHVSSVKTPLTGPYDKKKDSS